MISEYARMHRNAFQMPLASDYQLQYCSTVMNARLSPTIVYNK